MVKKRLEDKVINRRAFLGDIGKAGAGAILGSVPLINSCKGTTTPEPPPPPPPPISVNLEFTVYNHTKGLKGNFRKDNVTSETTLQIPVSELMSQYGINDVDNMSIIIKKPNLGMTVTKSFTGTAGLTVPRQNTAYDIFLLNIDGKGLYAANEASPHPRALTWGREVTIFRRDFDGKTGEERIWGGVLLPEIGEYGIIDQYNKALHPDSIPYSYGKINNKPLPNDGRGDFGYGFGECFGKDSTTASPGSTYPIFWVGINPTIANTVQWQARAGLERVLGLLMRSSLTYIGFDMGVIHDGAILNQKGKDFIAYLYLRDWSA